MRRHFHPRLSISRPQRGLLPCQCKRALDKPRPVLVAASARFCVIPGAAAAPNWPSLLCHLNRLAAPWPSGWGPAAPAGGRQNGKNNQPARAHKSSAAPVGRGGPIAGFLCLFSQLSSLRCSPLSHVRFCVVGLPDEVMRTPQQLTMRPRGRFAPGGRINFKKHFN